MSNSSTLSALQNISTGVPAPFIFSRPRRASPAHRPIKADFARELTINVGTPVLIAWFAGESHYLISRAVGNYVLFRKQTRLGSSVVKTLQTHRAQNDTALSDQRLTEIPFELRKELQASFLAAIPHGLIVARLDGS